MTDKDDVSFGSWRVTDARPTVIAAKDTGVEIWLTQTDLVAIDDDGGQPLIAWPVDQFSCASSGGTAIHLRLGFEADLWIESPQPAQARELIDGIIARRSAGAPIRDGEAIARTASGRTGPPGPDRSTEDPPGEAPGPTPDEVGSGLIASAAYHPAAAGCWAAIGGVAVTVVIAGLSSGSVAGVLLCLIALGVAGALAGRPFGLWFVGWFSLLMLIGEVILVGDGGIGATSAPPLFVPEMLVPLVPVPIAFGIATLAVSLVRRREQ